MAAAVVLCEACVHGAVDGSSRTLVRGETRLVANVCWMNLLATPPDTLGQRHRTHSSRDYQTMA